MLLSLPTLKDIQANDPYTYEALVKIQAAVNSLLAQIAPLSAAAGAPGVSQPPLKPTPQAVLPAIENSGGTWSNAGFCLFGNPNIGRSHSNLTDASPSLTVSGFASFAIFRTALVLNAVSRSEEHTSELQSRLHLVCRLLLEKKKQKTKKLCITRYAE